MKTKSILLAVLFCSVLVVVCGVLVSCAESTPIFPTSDGSVDNTSTDKSDQMGANLASLGASTWPTRIQDFKWPVVFGQVVRITAGYGPNGGSPYHYGFDYYAIDLVNGSLPSATRWMWILNPARGVISQIGWTSSTGWFMKIDHHNGWVTVIYHFQTDPRTFVRVGDDLLQGTFLGYTGSSGNATGPHIHFVIRRNGTSVPLNGIDGDSNLRIGSNYTSSNVYVRPPRGNP